MASLAANTICGCVDKLQNMWEEQNLSLKPQAVHCQHQFPFSEGKTPIGGVSLECLAQSQDWAGRRGCTQRPDRNPLHTHLLGKPQEDRSMWVILAALGIIQAVILPMISRILAWVKPWGTLVTVQKADSGQHDWGKFHKIYPHGCSTFSSSLLLVIPVGVTLADTQATVKTFFFPF